MAFTHIWNKLHLHRQKVTFSLLAVLLLLGNTTQAQQRDVALNKPGYDDRPVHYGFYLAVPFTKYNLQHSQAYVDQIRSVDPNISVRSKTDIGFYTGLVLNVRIAEYLDARFVPGVGFYGRTTEFRNIVVPNVETEDLMIETISNTMVELPLLLKYKSKRRSNFRPYIVAGVKPSIDLGKGNSGGKSQMLLEVEKYDLALEYGLGLDIFYPYFKFAPELRFSHGLINQHKPVDGSQYSAYIQKLTNHNVSLILFFE